MVSLCCVCSPPGRPSVEGHAKAHLVQGMSAPVTHRSASVQGVHRAATWYFLSTAQACPALFSFKIRNSVFDAASDLKFRIWLINITKCSSLPPLPFPVESDFRMFLHSTMLTLNKCEMMCSTVTACPFLRCSEKSGSGFSLLGSTAFHLLAKMELESDFPHVCLYGSVPV